MVICFVGLMLWNWCHPIEDRWETVIVKVDPYQLAISALILILTILWIFIRERRSAPVSAPFGVRLKAEIG